jgi:hypothetical protein
MLPNACLLIEKLGQQTGGGGNKEKSLKEAALARALARHAIFNKVEVGN